MNLSIRCMLSARARPTAPSWDVSDGMHVHSHPDLLCLQSSQARSATKDMTDAGTEAEFDTETGRLHNQFNFNDRAVQV